MTRLLWDLPLQRLAWRAYLSSREQARLYAAHCAAGDAPVRVLGSPKLDASVNAVPESWGRQLRARAKGRPVVLWNPHFRMEEGGWSTFHLYLQPLLQRFTQRSDLVLLVRPHFRLFADLAEIEGGPSRVETTLRRLAAEHDTIHLDDTADYTEALATADAMMSDLSSLATVFLPTGKPLLYLRREDGPGTNDEGAYFESMYQARSWEDVDAFLDMVRRGKDPQAAERAAAVERHFPYVDGRASRRIVDDIVESFRSELFLEDAPARPADALVTAGAAVNGSVREGV
nr:CDP-glycerol glycerophosphotransferase family protein [Motilibacter deserti]